MLKNNIKFSWIIIKIEKYFSSTQNIEKYEDERSGGRKTAAARFEFSSVFHVVEIFYKWHLMELIESE